MSRVSKREGGKQLWAGLAWPRAAAACEWAEARAHPHLCALTLNRLELRLQTMSLGRLIPLGRAELIDPSDGTRQLGGELGVSDGEPFRFGAQLLNLWAGRRHACWGWPWVEGSHTNWASHAGTNGGRCRAARHLTRVVGVGGRIGSVVVSGGVRLGRRSKRSMRYVTGCASVTWVRARRQVRAPRTARQSSWLRCGSESRAPITTSNGK